MECNSCGMLMTVLTEMVTSSRGKNKFYGSGVLVGSGVQSGSCDGREKREEETQAQIRAGLNIHGCKFTGYYYVHVSVGTPQTASDLGSIADVFDDNLSAPSHVGHVETIPPPDSRLVFPSMLQSQSPITTDTIV